MPIRAGTSADIPTIVRLGRDMHAESVYGRFGYDEQKIAETIQALIAGAGCVFVYEREGQVLGFFLGVIAEHWFGRSIMACDLALYVVPEARGGRAAVRLLEAFIAWAKLIGAQDIQVATSTGVHVERTGSLYQRMGFAHVGGLYKRQQEVEHV